MATKITKIVKSNFLPTTFEGRYPVYSERFNALVQGLADIGITENGIALDATSLETDVISEDTSGVGVTIDGTLIKDGRVISKLTPTAMNVTATATATQILSGYITSTSAAAVSITTPTATAIGTVIGASRGTIVDLVIDNSAGANTVTLILDASIAVVTPAITGGATLTVSTANAIGVFRLIFTSATTAKIFRIA